MRTNLIQADLIITLAPYKAQAEELERTLNIYAQACEFLKLVALRLRRRHWLELHRAAYDDVRRIFKLPPNLVYTAERRTIGRLHRHGTNVTFKPDSLELSYYCYKPINQVRAIQILAASGWLIVPHLASNAELNLIETVYPCFGVVRRRDENWLFEFYVNTKDFAKRYSNQSVLAGDL